MGRWLFAAGMVLSVGGCAHDAPPDPTQRLASKPCAKVAEIRLNDARVNGHDATDQQIVFRGAYADCVKWEAKGYEPPIR